eukprot:7377674-Prymnesium_polylepis.1
MPERESSYCVTGPHTQSTRAVRRIMYWKMRWSPTCEAITQSCNHAITQSGNHAISLLHHALEAPVAHFGCELEWREAGVLSQLALARREQLRRRAEFLELCNHAAITWHSRGNHV